MPKNDIERFVLDALAAEGAAMETLGYGLTEVVIPEALALVLQVPPLMTLVFDSEAHREAPEAMLVTYGHPLVDALIAYTLERHRGFRFYVHLDPHDYAVSAERVQSLLGQTLEFRKTRKPEVVSMAPIMGYDFSFRFRVAWQSSSRVEEVAEHLVDSQGNALSSSEYDRTFWQTEPGPHERVLPTMPPRPFAHLYQKVRQATEADAKARSKKLAESDRSQYDREYQRMQTYYQSTLQELKSKMATSSNDCRSQVFQERYRAAEADRDRRLADLRGAYTVDYQIVLDHVLMYGVPRMMVWLGLQQKAEHLSVPVLINLLTRTLDPFPCQVCSMPARSLTFESVWVGECCYQSAD